MSTYSRFSVLSLRRVKTVFIALILSLFAALFLSGCWLSLDSWALKRGYKDKATVESVITEMQKEHFKDLQVAQVEFDRRYNEALKAKNAQLQGAANGLYGADATFQTIKEPTRTDIVTNNFVTEAWAATGNLMPEHKTMLEINARLKRELDEKLTSLEDLKKTHAAQLVKNQALADEARRKDNEIIELKTLVQKRELEYAKALAAKQGDLLTINGKLLSLEKERADDRAWIEAQKSKLMIGCGILAALCIIGTIYSPVFKGKLAVGAGIFGLLTLGINYIQPWMLGAALGVGVLIIVGLMVYEHNKESRALSGVVGAVQSFKEKSEDAFNNNLKPLLDEWLTKYTKNGATVPDKAAQELIDKKLMEKDLK